MPKKQKGKRTKKTKQLEQDIEPKAVQEMKRKKNKDIKRKIILICRNIFNYKVNNIFCYGI